MLQSMTGFASTTAAIERADGTKVNVSFTLKSLNYRHFEALCKIPQALDALEPMIIQRLKSKLHRGHAYLTIYLSDPNAFRTDIQVSMSTVAGYIRALKTAQQQFNLPGEIGINDIMRFPNVFVAHEQSMDEKTKEQFLAIIDTLIATLVRERTTEGANLARDLHGRMTDMRTTIQQIKTLFEAGMKERQAHVSEQLTAAHQAGEYSDSVRAALYLELDKIDVHEEIVRFKSHLENLTAILDSNAPEVGKQLDFTLQELAREINTITAKANNVAMSAQAVRIKVELEKAREQAQNIV